MKLGLVAAAGQAALRALGCTWHLEWDGLDRLEQARQQSPGGNVIYALWHSSLAMLAWTHRHRGIQVLVSQHQDGEVIARILATLGYGLVRGSSRRGGVEALFSLAKQLDAGLDVAITVDGPVGPRYAVQPGVALLARRSGRPIVPVIASARRTLFLPTWDALRIPLPWTRLRVQHAPAQYIPAGAPEAAVTAARHQLQATLSQWTVREEARQGRRLELQDVQDKRGFFERQSTSPSPGLALRSVAALHAYGLRLERRLRVRPAGQGGSPWVIGVGNLEAGGTGKTPCVVALARAIAARGQRVAVLTRGHGGRLGRRVPEDGADAWAGASDETRLLVEALAGDARVVVSRNKRRGLDWLADGHTDVVVVDDAFQTAALPVDRHLVLLDWERPFGNGCLLPAGRLREPPSALERAHAIVFSRCHGAGFPSHPAWSHLGAGCLFRARESVARLVRPDRRAVDPASLRGKGVALLSGIGRPEAFERLVRDLGEIHGFMVRRAVRIGDHAAVEQPLARLVGRLAALGCSEVMLTRKDILRLPLGHTWNEPLLVVEQRLDFEELDALVDRLLPPALATRLVVSKVREVD